MRIITPKDETVIYPFEDYERNRKMYEARVAGFEFNQIQRNKKINPTKLRISRIQRIIEQFEKRHTKEVQE